MYSWCMAHPWMAFFLISFLILVISIACEQYFTVQNNKLKLEELKINNDLKQDKR